MQAFISDYMALSVTITSSLYEIALAVCYIGYNTKCSTSGLDTNSDTITVASASNAPGDIFQSSRHFAVV
jgi:hypothetical protein